MDDEEEVQEFLKNHAHSYGYNGTIDGIREREFSRLKGIKMLLVFRCFSPRKEIFTVPFNIQMTSAYLHWALKL